MSDISDRKAEHLDLCATDAVAFRDRTTLFEEVGLVHNALPELSLEEIDLGTDLCGKRLSAPLVIAAMTGGTDRAEAVNRSLATVAEAHGLGFGFGSMRPLLEQGTREGYHVRDVAPNALIFGNIGVVQAREAATSDVAHMVADTGCDALCVHLNPAMEVIQPGGDSDFRSGLRTLQRLVDELEVPVIVKETGCGLSREVGRRLVDIGVGTVDTSGAGGTSWVGVETLRAKARTKRLGELFWDWGIPTAASVAQLDGLGLDVIATGGVRDGVDVARALALGAAAGGIARRFLMALNEGGEEGLSAAAAEVIDEIRVACLLTGCRTPRDLAKQPLVIGGSLSRWIPLDAPVHARTAN